jgi:hypothetical protein
MLAVPIAGRRCPGSGLVHAAEVSGDDAIARVHQAGDHIDVAMDVVREPVKEKHYLAVA